MENFGRNFQNLDESLIRWGVPEDLIDDVDWPSWTGGLAGLPPQLILPDEWTVDGEPTTDRIRDAMKLGIGLVINDQDVFDFRWVEDGLASLTSLHCATLSDGYKGLDLLSKAVSLRYFFTPEEDEVIDFTGLEGLESTQIRGYGMLTAACAPHVRNVEVDVVLRDGVLLLSRSVESLTLTINGLDLDATLEQVPNLTSLCLFDSKGVDLLALRHVPKLTTLLLGDVDRVDLTPLRGLKSVEEIRIMGVRSVSGVSELMNCSGLRRLTIANARAVVGRDELLRLDLDEFHGSGPAFDADFARAAFSKGDGWEIAGNS